MKNTKKITKAQLIEMLRNWNHGAQPASIQYVTSPKLNKAGKVRFGDVTRIANVGIMIGYKYENSVNNQRTREEQIADFVSQPLWNGKGKRISTALSTHIEKGSFYLTYKAQQTFKSFHFDTALNFIPISLLRPYFPVYDTAKSQGVETAIYHREISVDNIRKLKFKKCTYEIVS
jgi:hypothetical protein